MITCEFKGRLANIMFQIAATHGIAHKFDDVAEFEDYTRSAEFPNHYPQGVPEWFTNFGLPLRTMDIENTFEEKGSRFQRIPKLPNLLLKGFFQSYKYFDNIKNELTNNIFKVPNNRQVGIVGVHVRRQDYHNYPDYFPVLPASYYFKAMKYFADGTQFLFFSDDMQWCMETFSGPNIKFFASNPINDLFMLANCDDFIIANSSFSWMAAYLCRNENKIVICPHKNQWYGKLATIDTTDFIPPTWTQQLIR